MYIDFKCTIWERVKVYDESLVDEIIQKLKSGEISDSNNLYDLYSQNILGELLLDSQEQMTVNDNFGLPTIEMYDSENSNRKLLYSNGE